MRAAARHAVVMVVALLAPPAALAASPEAVPVSPEAAMTAGAVLASDDVGGGGWYNPASLGAVTRSSVQVGASAYAESATLIDDAATVTLPWGTTSGDIRSLRYSSVPSVLSYSFKLREGLGLSIGVWTPYHDYEGGTTTITSSGAYPTNPPRAPPLNGTFAETYAFTERRDDTWGGVGVGWQATPRLRLGAMLQGAYSTDVWTIDVNTSLKTDSTVPGESGSHVVYSERGDVGILGLRTLFGLQWQAAPEWRLAAAVRGPSIRVFGWGPVNKFLSTAALLPDVAPSENQAATETQAARGVTMVEPVRIYGGLTYKEEAWTLAIEGDWHPSLNGQFGAFKEGWNGRMGATWRSSPDLRVGAGLFYDINSSEGSASMSAMKYAGFTGGVIYRPSAVVRVLSGGNDWDLLTSVAVRGAYGWGTYRGIALVPVDPAGVPINGFDPAALSTPDRPARVFEGSISFMTAIVF
jgi:hypothetical protein